MSTADLLHGPSINRLIITDSPTAHRSHGCSTERKTSSDAIAVNSIQPGSTVVYVM